MTCSHSWGSRQEKRSQAAVTAEECLLCDPDACSGLLQGPGHSEARGCGHGTGEIIDDLTNLVENTDDKLRTQTRHVKMVDKKSTSCGNAHIFQPRNPSNRQTEVQQSGLEKQRNEGQLILLLFSFPVAMTAGVVYLKIPDSESLPALLVPRALEAVPTLGDINVFYRSVNEEFLRTPFFQKKRRKRKKNPLLSLPPFLPTLCLQWLCLRDVAGHS
ncbi:syntaxin-8 isoform X5 [Pezoporus flaviventris]|uniref:syntaxin-8 isoform X5 n=1 Tax=Pezoporus flaviventris TaxID=889875 RepID=UPI002AB22AD8|nr:syntaxin-8 isoform X5 [Pezoporus flaviventris]